MIGLKYILIPLNGGSNVRINEIERKNERKKKEEE